MSTTPERAPKSDWGEDLIAEAWRLLQELLETGEAHLASGKVIGADHPVVDVARAIAKLRKPEARRMPVVDGLRVAKTRKAG